MSLLEKINPKNFFTKEEISVLLFLILFTVFGVILKIYKSSSQKEVVENQFEKTDIDSILVAIFSEERIDKSDVITTKKKEEPLKKKSININKASVEELTKLPGIGEKTAKKIVEYRQKYGGFKKIEDIMKIERIGPKLFEKIQDYIITK